MGSKTSEDALTYLLLYNTARKDIKAGKVPVIVRGEGNCVCDIDYRDLRWNPPSTLMISPVEKGR
jgi:hypothetical protein